ncbi:hypothetical protein NDU88_001941 [Pleurodeles waltl]|uniref:SPT3 homolog, SAGA and STAGA complex component n=1 Tax=Pleurodeles waltl TaxID=8319 RepID=A0AAV7RAK0_PLEWA|nr:hypothetical protein NDU88_001941 [Pleurodeles waltl]
MKRLDNIEGQLTTEAKKATKFRDWLDCSLMEIKPNAVAMEILAYLAYETVAQLVDLALLVKQDMSPKTCDPFSHAISATLINYHNTTELPAACGAESQSEAIQPGHIREAIRRYSHSFGPLSPFTVRNNRDGEKLYLSSLKTLIFFQVVKGRRTDIVTSNLWVL